MRWYYEADFAIMNSPDQGGFIMKLSDKLITLRKENGWSQEDFAEKLDVSRQAISRWENGTALPDAQNILQISKLFNVTADYLLNDDHEGESDTSSVEKNAEDAKPLVCLEPAVEYAANDNVLLYLGAGFTLCDGFDSFYVNPGLCYSITEDVWFDFGYTYDSAEGAADNSIQLDFVWNY